MQSRLSPSAERLSETIRQCLQKLRLARRASLDEGKTSLESVFQPAMSIKKQKEKAVLKTEPRTNEPRTIAYHLKSNVG
jgi:hypothetical protein